MFNTNIMFTCSKHNYTGLDSPCPDCEDGNSRPVEAEVMVKLADILKVLDDEEYTVSVFSNDTVDDKIAESIGNNAVIDFKKQLREELLSKFSA